MREKVSLLQFITSCLLVHTEAYCPDSCTSCGDSIDPKTGQQRTGFYDCSRDETMDEIPFGLPTKEITEMRFSENHITKILQLDFLEWPVLETLLMDKNNMTEVEPKAFNKLSSLIKLDLSFNKIKSFPLELFTPLTSLESLHIDNNELETLTPDLTFMTSLKVLTARNNKIHSIRWWNFQPSNLERLFLYQKSLNCTCNNYELKSWAKQTEAKQLELHQEDDSNPRFLNDLSFICRGQTFDPAQNCSIQVDKAGHDRDMSKIYSDEYSDLYTVGSNATLYCNYSGDPLPRIRWSSSNGLNAWDVDDEVDEFGRLHITNLTK